MAYLNTRGLGTLWDRISQVFGRRTQAAGSASLSGTTLIVVAIDGNTLSSVDLGGTFATDAEAGHSLGASGASITLYNVNGTALSTIDLSSAISGAVSSGTSGLMTQNSADVRYGRSLYLNGKTLSLLNANGLALSSVTLP